MSIVDKVKKFLEESDIESISTACLSKDAIVIEYRCQNTIHFDILCNKEIYRFTNKGVNSLPKLEETDFDIISGMNCNPVLLSFDDALKLARKELNPTKGSEFYKAPEYFI